MRRAPLVQVGASVATIRPAWPLSKGRLVDLKNASSIGNMADPIAELRGVVSATAPAPPEMATYLEKVRDRAYAVGDRDIEALTEAGFSEDVIFEQTVAVAIAEGLRKLDRANEVIG